METSQNKQPHPVVTHVVGFCFPPPVLGRKSIAEHQLLFDVEDTGTSQ